MTYGDVVDTYAAFETAKEFLSRARDTIVSRTPCSDKRVDATNTISKAVLQVENLQKMFDDEMAKKRAYRLVEPEEPDDDEEDEWNETGDGK